MSLYKGNHLAEISMKSLDGRSRATKHAWKNSGPDWSRYLTVVVPSEQVKVEATGEVLETTKIPGLSD